MLAAEKLSVTKGTRKILDDLSISARPGEVVALLGANGAGKTTLLRSLTGGEKRFAGRVTLDGLDIDSIGYHKLARRRAVLSQSPRLDFPFTARQVALLGRNPHITGRETARDRSIVGEALEMVHAASIAERNYMTLSGGEQQRVQIARVLAQIWEKPKSGGRYLLLDEPTNNLDISHQHLLMEIARRFAESNVCVVAVLHDLNLAARYADRVVILKNGRILDEGEPNSTLNASTINEAFGINLNVADLAANGRPVVYRA